MFKNWKINSIGYAYPVLSIVGLLLVILPLALYFCSWLLGLLGIKSPSLLLAIRISFTAGMSLLTLFVLLLAVEFIQDRILEKSALKHKNRKLLLKYGHYECQYCGSRKVLSSHTQCPTCGKSFLENGDS